MDKVIYKKTLVIGMNHKGGTVDIEIKLKESDKGIEFTACGNSWLRSGNDTYLGGQCIDSLPDEIKTWLIDPHQFNKIELVWQRWHLNDMNAGCFHQHQTLRENPEWSRDYTELIKRDGFMSCDICDYKYGSAWLREDLPEDVIAEIKSW